MSKTVLTLSSLLNGCPIAKTRFIEQLKQRGFACLALDNQALLSALEDGLEEARRLEGFRFPPNDESPTVYNRVTRATFRALFEVSTGCFRALCAHETVPGVLQDALDALSQPGPVLFGEDAQPHEPFCDAHVFAQSFFNLFNYNHGLLNPHFDRSLLTVIKALGGKNQEQPQSALWIRGSDGEWTNADQAVSPDEVIIMIGEDCETLDFASRLGLYAAKHAVRVDPAGQYIAHSHFRPDPNTPTQHNRRSAAFILRHDPISLGS